MNRCIEAGEARWRYLTAFPLALVIGHTGMETAAQPLIAYRNMFIFEEQRHSQIHTVNTGAAPKELGDLLRYRALRCSPRWLGRGAYPPCCAEIAKCPFVA